MIYRDKIMTSERQQIVSHVKLRLMIILNHFLRWLIGCLVYKTAIKWLKITIGLSL